MNGELKKETLDIQKDLQKNERSIVKYAEKICNSVAFQPDTIYSMDMCTSEGCPSIVELNSFSCSGLYACDLKIIVEKASELAVSEWNEINIKEQ